MGTMNAHRPREQRKPHSNAGAARIVTWLTLSAALLALVLAPGVAGAQGAGQGATATPPGASGSAPGRATDIPGPTATAPGRSGDAPGQPVAATAQAEAAARQTAAAQTPPPGQSGQAGQGQAQATNTPGPAGTPRPGDKSIEKVVIPTDGGRGTKAADVRHGTEVTYEIRVTGAPPGQRRGQVEDELRDNAPPKLDYKAGSATRNGSPVSASYDGNKVVIQEENFQDGQTIVYRLTFTVRADAPCNHVATNVAHVNGIGSDQAQVRIVCPSGTPTATATATATLAASATPTATARPDMLTVRKSLEDEEGRTVGQIGADDLGKVYRYNILIRRNGGLPGRTQMAFRDVMQPCGSNSVQEFFPQVVRAEIQGGEPSDEFTYTINGCTVEGRISGDNKANFDAGGPGNQFHVHIWVRLPQAGTIAAQNPPREITNTVTVSVEGGPTATDTLRTPVNIPAAGGRAAQGPRPAGSVNLPAPVEGRLAGPVEVAGVTLQPGESVQIVALPPGAVIQTPPGGGRVAVPPGSVLGVTSRPDLGQVVTQTPVFVEVLDVGTVRAPAPGALPQTGTGPAPLLLPQTGSSAGVATVAPWAWAAAASLLLGAVVRSRRRK